MRQAQSPNPRSAGRPVQVLAIAFAMFAAILAWRFADSDPASAIGSLYVVPVALLAVTFGTWGGMAGATLALALCFLWAQIEEAGLGVDGYFARGLTFAAVAVVVGWQLEDRHRFQAEAVVFDLR